MTETENVFQRCAACITNGVITSTHILMDDNDEPIINEDTGRPRTAPDNPKQATVWQTMYRKRGSLRPNIVRAENPGSEMFFDILDDTGNVVVYQMHHNLLDKNQEMIPLERDNEKFQRGDYLLVLVSPTQRKRDKGNPRDKLLALLNEELPDLEELDSICTGEDMFDALEENDDIPEETITDLFSRLTYPRLTGDRTAVEPNQCIFIRTNSGFDQLYVNEQGIRSRQAAGEAAELPDSEPADVLGTGQKPA